MNEIDRRIGERLRRFRIENIGLTAAEFARRLGIDSNRLATYEHGRVPLRFEIANMACKEFRVNLRWLAEGSEPSEHYVHIPQELANKIPQRALLSEVYGVFLKRYFDDYFEHLLQMWDGKIDAEGLAVIEELGQNQLKAYSELEVLSVFLRYFIQCIDKLPPDLYPPFFTEILRSARGLEKQYAARIEEWKNTPKERPKPEWAAETLKSDLTNKADSLTTDPVKPVLPKLIERLNRATAARGSKSELAEWLGVHRQSVTDWLSGKQEPGGEVTLRMLQWVEQRERQK